MGHSGLGTTEQAPPPAEGSSAVAAFPGGASAHVGAEEMEDSDDGFHDGELSPQQHEAFMKLAMEVSLSHTSPSHVRKTSCALSIHTLIHPRACAWRRFGKVATSFMDTHTCACTRARAHMHKPVSTCSSVF